MTPQYTLVKRSHIWKRQRKRWFKKKNI